MVLDLLLIMALGVLLTACALPDSTRADLHQWARRRRRRPVQPARRARRSTRSRHGPVLRGLDTTRRVSDAEWNALVARLRDHDDLDVD